MVSFGGFLESGICQFVGLWLGWSGQGTPGGKCENGNIDTKPRFVEPNVR
jgi:hypothetical protein